MKSEKLAFGFWLLAVGKISGSPLAGSIFSFEETQKLFWFFTHLFVSLQAEILNYLYIRIKKWIIIMTKSMNLRKELFPGEHKLDEKICQAGEKRLQRRRLAQKLYPLNEEEFQQQYQFARAKIAQFVDL